MTAATSSVPRPTSDAAAWALLLLLGLAVAALQWRSPLPIEQASLRNLLLACATLSGAAIFYRRVRPQEQFAVMCIGLMHVLLFSVLGAILSYLLARESGALWDDRFAAWDHALGFDWLGYVRLVDSLPSLALLFRLSYVSLVPQVIALVCVLGFTLRLAELRSTLLAAIVSGSTIVLLSPLFPAVSNFVHLGLDAADFRSVNPHAGYLHLAHFTALRDGTMASLRLTEMQGIITFPSYHAGLATVTCWGFWRSGIGSMRAIGCPVALLTIAATPVDGGHYFVDVIAGVAIGILSIAVASRAVTWSPRPFVTAWPSRRSRAASAP